MQRHDALATRTATAAYEGIYRVEMDTGKLVKLSEARAFVIAWTVDSKAIWYSTATSPHSAGGGGQIGRLDVSNGADSLILDLAGAGWVQLAPAAGRAAFSRSRPGLDYEVDVFGTVEGERKLGEGSHLTLSEDGSLLAYISPSCVGVPRLKIIDLVHGGSALDVPDLSVDFLEWLPDGRAAVRLGGQQVPSPRWVIVDPATPAVTPMRDFVGTDSFDSFSLSPDEKHALLYTDGPDPRFVVRDIATGVETGVPVQPAAWAPDSSRLVFAESDKLIVTSNAGQVLNTVPLPVVVGSDDGIYALKWSPDGRSVVFSVAPRWGTGVCD